MDCTRQLCILAIVALVSLADTGLAAGNTYYIATNGSDANSGNIANPFASFDHAISLANPGDTILVRGGTYNLNTTIQINKSGTVGNPINLWAMPGETPILDFSSNPRHVNPPQPRDDDSIAATNDAIGILLGGGTDYWHMKGLTVRNSAYYGVRIYGSNNVVEQFVIHDSKASGLEITGKEGWVPSNNLILNSDSYHNFDPQTNGEDADGFTAKFDSLGPGNVFSGLRSWSNSDDGYDFWHAVHPVLIENSWAFDNGFNRPEWASQISGNWQGDGLGFKLGQAASELVLNRVAAFGNKAFGIDENGNGSAGGLVINNATLVNNAKDGNPIQISLNDGSPHTITNTVAFDIDGSSVTQITGPVTQINNTWNGSTGVVVTVADFVNLNMAQLLADAKSARGPDGSLPDIGLHLAFLSDLIDAGVDVGLPFYGAAPDLGAFEWLPPILFGDANNDGVVDYFDIIAVEENIGSIGDDNGLLVGDANDDGRVDGADFITVEQNFGQSLGSSPVVPEPASLALLATLLMYPRRRTRRKA